MSQCILILFISNNQTFFCFCLAWIVRSASVSCFEWRRRTRRSWSESCCASRSTVRRSGRTSGRRTRRSSTTSHTSRKTGGWRTANLRRWVENLRRWVEDERVNRFHRKVGIFKYHVVTVLFFVRDQHN